MPSLPSHTLGGGKHQLDAADGRAVQTAAIKSEVLPAAAAKAVGPGPSLVVLACSALGGAAGGACPAFAFETASRISGKEHFTSTQLALLTCQKVPAIAAAFHELRTRHPTTLGSSKGKGVPAAMRAALTDPACGLHWAVARLPQPGQPGDEPAGCPGVGAFHPGRLRQPC